jgi:hypothetical protein
MRIFSTICFFVVLSPLISFASPQAIEGAKTLQESCKLLEKKVVSYVASVFFVEKCKLRPIKDSAVVNDFLISQQEKMIPINEKIYALLPIGEEYRYEDYEVQFAPLSEENKCKKYNNKVITADNIDYYFVENCKKRKFANYSDVENFAKSTQPLYFIASVQLKWFPNGKDMAMNTDDILKMGLPESDVLAHIPDKKVLCSSIENRVTAFYTSFFYVEKCKLRPITSMPIELQREAEQRGGIVELTLPQRLGIPIGDDIAADKVNY